MQLTNLMGIKSFSNLLFLLFTKYGYHEMLFFDTSKYQLVLAKMFTSVPSHYINVI